MGAPGGGKWSPSWGQNASKSKTKKTMQQEGLQDRLGEVLEPSWSGLRAILAALEAILGRFRGVRGVQNHCFSIGFSLYFEKSIFGMQMLILTGLGAILVSPSPTTGLGGFRPANPSFFFSTPNRTSTSPQLHYSKSSQHNSFFDPPRPSF